MMRYVVASIALVVSGFALYAMAADPAPPGSYRVVTVADADQQEIADLKAGITQLQAELDGLKERLKTLESARKLRVLPAPHLGHRPLAEPIPPEWHRREFNGRPVYIIPLAKDPVAGRD